MVICNLNFGAGKTFLRKKFKIIFQRILMLRKYFWIFVKTEKVLEKNLACKSVFKIQKCSGENSKGREKQNGVK